MPKKKPTPTDFKPPARRKQTAIARPAVADLLEHFISQYRGATLDAYRRDIRMFCEYTGEPTPEDAIAALVKGGKGAANTAVLDWRKSMIDAGLAPKTVNRRLSALRSMIAQARIMGLVEWAIDVKGVKDAEVRDPRGPGEKAFRAMIWYAEQSKDPIGLRNLAILRLLHDIALRRGEVSRLNVEDYDAETGALMVLGKGRYRQEKKDLPTPTRAALDAWLEEHDADEGPMFIALDAVYRGHRLTPQSIYKTVKAIGKAVGADVRPHGLRHTAITTALDRTGGDVRAVAQFARHTDVRVTMQYDDARKESAKRVADLVSWPGENEYEDENED